MFITVLSFFQSRYNATYVLVGWNCLPFTLCYNVNHIFIRSGSSFRMPFTGAFFIGERILCIRNSYIDVYEALHTLDMRFLLTPLKHSSHHTQYFNYHRIIH